MMEKQNSYSHILKYTSLFGGVQVLSILVGLVRNKLVALILGPMGMGLLALFSSTIKLVGDSTNLGLSISAVRNMSGAYDCGDMSTFCVASACFVIGLCSPLFSACWCALCCRRCSVAGPSLLATTRSTSCCLLRWWL